MLIIILNSYLCLSAFCGSYPNQIGTKAPAAAYNYLQVLSKVKLPAMHIPANTKTDYRSIIGNERSRFRFLLTNHRIQF